MLLSCVLLALVLGLAHLISRRLGFNRADEITIVFCGSKRAWHNGVATANTMFPPPASGGVLPRWPPPDPADGGARVARCEQEAVPQVQEVSGG